MANDANKSATPFKALRESPILRDILPLLIAAKIKSMVFALYQTGRVTSEVMNALLKPAEVASGKIDIDDEGGLVATNDGGAEFLRMVSLLSQLPAGFIGPCGFIEQGPHPDKWPGLSMRIG